MDLLDRQQNLGRFRELVLADPELHDQLRAAATEQDFIVLAVRFGAERGCAFSAEELQAALREQRRVWLERWI